MIITSWLSATIAPKAKTNSNRIETYNKMSNSAEQIAITAFPVSSAPILGPTFSMVKINSFESSGILSTNDLAKWSNTI